MNQCEYCKSEEKLVTVIYSENEVETERKMFCEACDCAEARLFEEDILEQDNDE